MVSRGLRWCHRCWLIRNYCLCSKTAYVILSQLPPLLCLLNGSVVKLNQQSNFQCLLGRPFHAHDSMEDLKALRKIVFESGLEISEEMLTEPMSTTQHAFDDLKYLDRRFELLQTFRGTLFHPTNTEFPIKQQMTEKIAGSGIPYQDLRNVFEKFGVKGLVGALSLPPSSYTSKTPRVAKTTRILKWYYDQKIISLFSSDFESVFA